MDAITGALLLARTLADVSLLAFDTQATGLWVIGGKRAGAPFGRVSSCYE